MRLEGFRLDSRVALMTGAAQGSGRATAEALAAAGEVLVQLPAGLVQLGAGASPVLADPPGFGVDLHQELLQARVIAGQQQAADGAVVVAVEHSQPPE